MHLILNWGKSSFTLKKKKKVQLVEFYLFWPIIFSLFSHYVLLERRMLQSYK